SLHISPKPTSVSNHRKQSILLAESIFPLFLSVGISVELKIFLLSN
ncbi:Uncharacterized protein TCM_033178 isoform 2, partial [Theobroma cacao]